MNKFHFTRAKLIQIFLTLFTLVILVIIPAISYILFKITYSNDALLEIFALKYDLVFITIIISGIVLTVMRYMMYNYPKYTLRRGTLNLLHSIIIVVMIAITSQIGNITIKLPDSGFSLNLANVFLLLITIWSLFIAKHVYDIIDFKIHHIYYDKLRRELSQQPRADFRGKNLVECPNCNYMCKSYWKSCPICHALLNKKK